MEDKCRLRLSLSLDRVRRPLHELQRQVEKIDPDPIQDPLEGEDAPAEIMNDDVLDIVMKGTVR